MVFQCKMCAGNLKFEPRDTICTCEFCGTMQTLPRLDSDRKIMLYERANRLRFNNEFDRAMSIYEDILKDDLTDAESYWSLVLCRYGIGYVKDPATGVLKPTVRRMQYTSVFDDEDYKEALVYADDKQKNLYEQEAKVIDDIQKQILAVSSKEEPFDVFICYKESDDNGGRTQDSVIGYDLYKEMTGEGLKVFFSRVTLEDKLGVEYEPYIFAALNSARVMLTIGTKSDYFNAAWVKNEWSRYLMLLSKPDFKRIMIPVYNDPSDLPNELSLLQGMDINKIGYQQDLTHQIKKIIEREKGVNQPGGQVVVQQVGNLDVNALLKRGKLLLEDGEWEQADGLYEDVLNRDAENAEAYLGKLLGKCRKSDVDGLTEFYKAEYLSCDVERLEAVVRDGARIDDAVANYVLDGYISEEQIRKMYSFDRYYESKVASRKKQKEEQLKELSEDKLLGRVKQYSQGELRSSIDSMLTEIENTLSERIVKAQKEDEENAVKVKAAYGEFLETTDKNLKALYESAVNQREEKYQSLCTRLKNAKTKDECEDLEKLFKSLCGYKDSEELAAKSLKKIKSIARKKRRKVRMVIWVALLCVAVYLLISQVVVPRIQYQKGVEKYKGSELANAQVGDVITFGDYNGNTEWIVMQRFDDQIYVMSKYIVTQRGYMDKRKNASWKKSGVRKWLNGEYKKAAFGDAEQGLIINYDYGSSKEKISLPSSSEVVGKDESIRIATMKDGKNLGYWVKDRGRDQNSMMRDTRKNACFIAIDGTLHNEYNGVNAADPEGGVRPTMWLDVSDLK